MNSFQIKSNVLPNECLQWCELSKLLKTRTPTGFVHFHQNEIPEHVSKFSRTIPGHVSKFSRTCSFWMNIDINENIFFLFYHFKSASLWGHFHIFEDIRILWITFPVLESELPIFHNFSWIPGRVRTLFQLVLGRLTDLIDCWIVLGADSINRS